jgi:hypothetical protein
MTDPTRGPCTRCGEAMTRYGRQGSAVCDDCLAERFREIHGDSPRDVPGDEGQEARDEGGNDHD